MQLESGGLAIALPGGLAAIGVGCLLVAGWGIVGSLGTLGWERADGRIVSSAVDERDRPGRRGLLGEDSSYAAEVSYTYSAGGQSYTGDVISVTGLVVADVLRMSGGAGESAAENLAAAYPPGSAVDVWYDPSDPSVAALDTSPGNLAIVALGLGVVLLVSAGGGLWFLSRPGE